MPNTIELVKNYSIKSGDSFFFDNNIWMFLYCPIGNYKKHQQEKFSKFLEYILHRGNPIYTNSLVLSEFSNRYLKLEYDLLRKDPLNAGSYNDYKKKFVGSPQYLSAIAQIKIHIRNILKIATKCSDEFNSINLDEMLNVFTNIGFNDSYYLHLAKIKNWIIVTDDGDFTNNKIPDYNLKIIH